MGHLSDAHRQLNLYEEGILRAKEALEIYERLNDTPGQGQSLIHIAWSLHNDGQLDAAEEAASPAINLLSNEGGQFRVCQCHRLLGNIYHSRDEIEKAANHFETALRIASSFNWHDELFWVHYTMALLLPGDAHAHVERAKSHAIDSPYRFEEAKSEALHAVNLFEKLGATEDVMKCRGLLEQIEEEKMEPVFSGELYFSGVGEPLEMAPANSPLSARGPGHDLT